MSAQTTLAIRAARGLIRCIVEVNEMLSKNMRHLVFFGGGVMLRFSHSKHFRQNLISPLKKPGDCAIKDLSVASHLAALKLRIQCLGELDLS